MPADDVPEQDSAPIPSLRRAELLHQFVNDVLHTETFPDDDETIVLHQIIQQGFLK